MKRIHPIWLGIWQSVIVAFLFVLSLILLVGYLPVFQQWLKDTFDSTAQQKTGIIMLGIGSFSFVVMFFTGCFRR